MKQGSENTLFFIIVVRDKSPPITPIRKNAMLISLVIVINLSLTLQYAIKSGTAEMFDMLSNLDGQDLSKSDELTMATKRNKDNIVKMMIVIAWRLDTVTR